MLPEISFSGYLSFNVNRVVLLHTKKPGMIFLQCCLLCSYAFCFFTSSLSYANTSSTMYSIFFCGIQPVWAVSFSWLPQIRGVPLGRIRDESAATCIFSPPMRASYQVSHGLYMPSLSIYCRPAHSCLFQLSAEALCRHL